jgi:hypothetical protein
MKWWPFKKKKLTPIAKTEPYIVTLDSNDTPKERALKMCQVAGLVINRNMYDRLDDITAVFEFYQKQDRLSRLRSKKKGE